MSRKRTWIICGLALFFGLLVASCGGDECDCAEANNEQLEVGDEAPDFRLQDHTGRYVRLSDYLGKDNVVLSFYPAAFTPV